MTLIWQKIKNWDWALFLMMMTLLVFGLVIIYSVSLNQEGVAFSSFKKQLIFSFLGLSVYLVLGLINYRSLSAYSNWLYLMGAILLLGVLFWGHTIRGTRGWFQLGGVFIQPVEVIKIITVIFLAKYFTSWARQINQFRHIFLSGLGVLIFFSLIMFQPDFGSAAILFFVWLAMLLAVGVRRLYLLFLLTGFVTVSVLGWNYVLKPYQKERLGIFLNPSSDPLGSGYNLTQSMVAIGSGGLLGRGLGFGSQSQLRFLPESRTDFIFAVIGEELGLAGVVVFLSLLAGLFYRLIKAAMRAPDDFGLFLVLGITFSLFIQAFFNLSMNMGMAPVTGISLPLMSYGGSYLLTTLAMLGIVQSVVANSKQFSLTHSIQ